MSDRDNDDGEDWVVKRWVIDPLTRRRLYPVPYIKPESGTQAPIRKVVHEPDRVVTNPYWPKLPDTLPPSTEPVPVEAPSKPVDEPEKVPA